MCLPCVFTIISPCFHHVVTTRFPEISTVQRGNPRPRRLGRGHRGGCPAARGQCDAERLGVPAPVGCPVLQTKQLSVRIGMVGWDGWVTLW